MTDRSEMKYRGYALGNIYPTHTSAIKRSLLNIFSRRFLQEARFESQFLKIQLKRLVSPRFADLGGKLYLNIAPGPVSNPCFFNVDAFSYPGIDYVFDCRKRLPVRDNSLEGILTEHFIEHLDYVDDLPRFLSECIRVLKPGGTLRVITPDAEKYFLSYLNGGLEEMERVRNVAPGFFNTKIEIINELFHQGVEHKFIFDRETLSMCCCHAGFREVTACEFREGRNIDLLIDSEQRESESLYLEATK